MIWKAQYWPVNTADMSAARRGLCSYGNAWHVMIDAVSCANASHHCADCQQHGLAQGSSVVPIRVQSLGGCALESSFKGGVKRERLRSLCQVHNATQLRLQVALATLPSDHNEWQEVPQQAASRRRPSQVLCPASF